MSVVYLGKRRMDSQGGRAKRAAAYDAPVYLGTQVAVPRRALPPLPRPLPMRARGPYRTGGFYGASVRSPIEKKVIDTALSNYDVNSTGSVTLISGCATGTDYTERIGRRTNITAIQLRGRMQVDCSSYSGVPQVGRVMLVEDMQCNGTIAAITDILQTANVHSFNNLNNRERFKIHHDQLFDFGVYSFTATQSYADNLMHHYEVYKSVNIPVVYDGTSNTIGSISSGAIYLVFIGSGPAGTNDLIAPTTCRVRFIDA